MAALATEWFISAEIQLCYFI